MKKNIITALLMLFTVSAMAQEIDNSYRLYVQAHLNGSYSSNENMRYDPMTFADALSLGGDVAVGYNLNDFWGLYFELAYNKNKGAQDFFNTPNGPVYGKNITGFSYNSIEPSINGSYNLSNGFFGYKPGRRNNWYVEVGFGAAFTSGNNATGPAIDPSNKTVLFGKLGLNYVYNINNWLAFTAHAQGHIFGDDFNGHPDKDVALDGRISLGAGLRVYLTKSKKPTREIVYRDDIIVHHDTVRVREEVVVNDQDVYPIIFQTNKSDIASANTADLAKVAQALKTNPSKVVYVLGYAEKETESTDADKLASERASVITSELINKYGIDPVRVITHRIGTQAQPYVNQANKNRATICIITDLKHF